MAGVAKVADDEANADAGKLFAGENANAGGAVADAAAIAKAAAAVTAVSGEQILKAIVDAAGAAAAAQVGAGAGAATNPIAAAIGAANDNGADFGQDEMKKRNDKIAAAIVLRGVAKGGKFAVADANSKASVKSAVESAVDEVSKWLEEMITAADAAAAKVGDGGDEKIGDVGAANNKGAKADASSVKEIAKGIKGIVDAAGKAFGGDALKDVKTAGDDNKEAGKLFAGANGNAGANAAAADDIAKAAGAVTAVSGEQ
ncbi:variable large family protein, partial [Borreliella afzelii]|uniref:variable large family protein n=1 Tax=Borreliella afzelii TaxID=29518 RepID=UPI003AF66576